MSKIIKDPVHGHISVADFGTELIDTIEVQRLRRIRQLGFSYLVYPGANHTRFEHTLGTYHLATVLGRNIGKEEEEWKAVQAAAILHDIGHGPFSHTSEKIIEKASNLSHEDFAIEKIKQTSLSDILIKNNISPERVIELIKGKGKYGEAISSELDVDRMDYLVRDAHYTGVAYGSIDYERLINEIKFKNGELIVESGGLEAAESLLVSRFLMQPTVYFHHASRIAETMVIKAIEKAFRENYIEPEELRQMFDKEVLLKMRESDDSYLEEIANRLLNRNLLKEAVSKNTKIAEKNDLINKMKNNKNLKLKKEKEISEKCGCDNLVIIDIPSHPEMDEMKTKVVEGDKIKKIGEASNLAKILSESSRDYLKFKIYAPKEKTEKVKKVSKRDLNI